MIEKEVAVIHDGEGAYYRKPGSARVHRAFFDDKRHRFYLHSWYPEECCALDIDEDEFQTIEDLEAAMAQIAALNKWDWD